MNKLTPIGVRPGVRPCQPIQGSGRPLADEVRAAVGERGWPEALRILSEAAPVQRRAALAELITDGNGHLATEAANTAILDDNSEFAGLIGANIGRWDGREVGTVIVGAAAYKQPAFLDVPRGLCAAVLRERSAAKWADASDPVGQAAVMLAVFGGEADRRVVLDLGGIAPSSPGVWTAISVAGNIDPARAALAAKTYRDEGAEMVTRVAAAAAVEGTDPKARQFALAQLRVFLDKFMNREPGPIFGLFYASHDGTQPEMLQYLQDLQMRPVMRTLMVMRAEELPALVVGQFYSAEPTIRAECAAVASIRWPEKFLDAPAGKLTEQEYAAALAILKSRHPEYAAVVDGRATPATLKVAEERMAKLQSAGVGAALLQAFWK